MVFPRPIPARGELRPAQLALRVLERALDKVAPRTQLGDALERRVGRRVQQRIAVLAWLVELPDDQPFGVARRATLDDHPHSEERATGAQDAALAVTQLDSAPESARTARQLPHFARRHGGDILARHLTNPDYRRSRYLRRV